MNRTVQNSRIKLTIFFVTSLFAMTFLFQSTAYGQVPPIVRTPRVSRIVIPAPIIVRSPRTSTIAKPSPITIVNPNLPPRPLDANRFKPDLRVDVKYDATQCKVYIQVVNEGASDAGDFRVWVQYFNSDGDNHRTDGRLSEIKGLAAQETVSLVESFYADGTGWWGTKGCFFDKFTRVEVFADPWIQYQGYKNTLGIVAPGFNQRSFPFSTDPIRIEESKIDESNEDNNGLIINIAAVKPYSAPPAI